MYKILGIEEPKFPDLINTYVVIIDNDAAPGETRVIVNPYHVFIMADGTEKYTKDLKAGDEAIMF